MFCFVVAPMIERKQVAGSTICTWFRERRRKKPTLEKSWLQHMLMMKRRCCFKHSVQKKLINLQQDRQGMCFSMLNTQIYFGQAVCNAKYPNIFGSSCSKRKKDQMYLGQAVWGKKDQIYLGQVVWGKRDQIYLGQAVWGKKDQIYLGQAVWGKKDQIYLGQAVWGSSLWLVWGAPLSPEATLRPCKRCCVPVIVVPLVPPDH